MTFHPLHDRVLVQPVETAPNKLTDLLDPDPASQNAQEGKIIATGGGMRDEDGMSSPLDVKMGDRILFSQGTGSPVLLDGVNLIIIKEEDVLGTIR